MRLIFAAFQLIRSHNLLTLTQDVLESYLAVKKNTKSFSEQLDAIDSAQGTLLLDSGAFSAWTKGQKIDLDEYAQFILQFQDRTTAFANLDVIPGEFGRIPNASEVDASAQKGWENYLKLLEKGVDPNKLIHVFHQGEEFSWLEKLIEKAPYIGISPANDRTTSQKIAWLDRVMKIACDSNGMPRNRWHGFGVTSFDIMMRYPWFSVDSTSWMRYGIFGAVLVPIERGGKFVYNEFPRRVFTSSRSPAVKQEGEHYETLYPLEKAKADAFFKEQGYTYEQLREDDVARHVINIRMFKALARNIPEYPWSYKPPTQGTFLD